MVSTELYIAASSTFRVSQGEKASLKISKKYEYFPNDVFYKRLPDDWTYSTNDMADTSLPLTFENISQADAGIYVLGSTSSSDTFGNTREDIDMRGAYFHLIVQGKVGMLFGD